MTGFGPPPAVKRNLPCGFERLSQLIPDGYCGGRRRGLEWMQARGISRQPGRGMKDWP
jgi:hypothetical protein